LFDESHGRERKWDVRSLAMPTQHFPFSRALADATS